jgi:hypothetical protein
LACLIGASIGFFRIKPLEHAGANEPPELGTPTRSHPDRVAAR